MELSTLIGTNPQYPKIVNHSGIIADPANYDNYPSDNNSVRVIPKLQALWNTQQEGPQLIPNLSVMPLGLKPTEDPTVVPCLVREAKKAVMCGLSGKQLSEHLRVRYTPAQINAASEELKKVADEIGLLGNVYIDASAFEDFRDAEQFLRQHRSRLAREMLVSSTFADSMSHIASVFHKNVVSKIDYNEELFKRYKAYLVSAGKIDRNTVIDSKESLRQAFLYKRPNEIPFVKKSTVAMDKNKINETLSVIAEENNQKRAEVQDTLNQAKIVPIVSFIQENLSKGKEVWGIKEMTRKKFMLDDIKIASEAIKISLSKEGLTETNIDKAVEAKTISKRLGSELKRIGGKYPIKEVVNVITPRMESRPTGTFYSLNVPTYSALTLDGYKKASLEALRKGFDINQVQLKLRAKLSREEADAVISEAIKVFNSSPIGVKANKIEPAKKVIIPETSVKATLPDPETILPQTQEMLDIFANTSEFIVDIDPVSSYSSVDVNEMSVGEGISEAI